MHGTARRNTILMTEAVNAGKNGCNCGSKKGGAAAILFDEVENGEHGVTDK
jgi:hypothetical protein